MSEDRKSLLIVGQSGRALAQSARRGGWRPLVADAFADVDTKAAAHRVIQVAANDGSLNERRLVAALSRLPGADAGLIYGAGLEARPRLLKRLSDSYRIVGNASEVVRSINTPRTFFQILRSLGVPFPETRFEPPKDASDSWLTKRAGGAGGGHIRRWNGARISRRVRYFQRYQAGQAMSALFAADGHRAQIIGYNTQWRGAQGAQSFAYAGALNRAQLTAPERGIVVRYVKALTRVFSLRGLNSLDFVFYRGTAFVLEINPRPTATCELYEPDTHDGMVALHVRACSDELPEWPRIDPARVRAHAIVYAQAPGCVPIDLQWPRWCHDLPRPGIGVVAGQPICSVHAEGDGVARVQQLVHARRQSVLSALNLRPMAA